MLVGTVEMPCRKHRLGLRLGQQGALGARRLPHGVERSSPVDAGKIGLARRRAHQCRLSLGVLPEKAEALDRVARRLVGGDVCRLELRSRFGCGRRQASW
jgi:hypothetical protein